jgi:tRNA-specific 2-thiouridylase
VPNEQNPPASAEVSGNFPESAAVKVLVGLSGGVDSSVAALLLKKRGYAVTGVTMSVYGGPIAGGPQPGGNACYDCGEEEDIAAAALFAKNLGIPYKVFDCAKQYKSLVLDYFKNTYLAGQTPNPCVRCNHMLKFGLLPELARQNGLDYDCFATGHYARVEFSGRHNRYVLRRGVDPRKDQAYFLYRLDQTQLSRALFPLGGMYKQDVRAIAAEHGLAVHNKPDSQDFYSGGYTELLNLAELPGNIVNRDGKVLGRHTGYWHFTPGQRKGLGIAAAEPLFVLELDPAHNEVVVGSYAQSLYSGCTLNELRINVPLHELTPDERANLRCKMRSAQQPVAVTLQDPSPCTLAPEQLELRFNEPQTGVAPGQSLVLYLDDLVIGGGIIQKRKQNGERHA